MTISGEVIPVRIPKPVPAIQVRRTSIRAIPEITACAVSPYEGAIPSSPSENSPPNDLVLIAGEASPVRIPKPDPAIQARRTSMRAIPERTAH